MRVEVLDLFSGAGGFSWGAHQVADHVMGIEWDADAVATQHAAGMGCVRSDIRGMNPCAFQKLHATAHYHLHASPPCTTFSAAGRGHGRNSIKVLGDAVINGTRLDASIDETTRLVLEPKRWIEAVRPDSISFEQVRAVLPVWEAYAEWLQGLGYHTWTGQLHAEQYGVAQTRSRAWLMASLHGPVEPPAPTHSRYHVRTPERLDEGVPRWVSMADALACSEADLVGFPRRADNDATVEIDGVDYRARDLRSGDQPSFALTEKARSWTHYAPAGVSTVTSMGNHYLFNPEDDTFGENLRGPGGWDPNKPATTVAGDPRISARGHHYHGEQGRAPVSSETVFDWLRDGAPPIVDVNRAQKITIEEAAVLQGFPADYPWQGSKTSQFRQAGNAVPPPVARAVLEALL